MNFGRYLFESNKKHYIQVGRLVRNAIAPGGITDRTVDFIFLVLIAFSHGEAFLDPLMIRVRGSSLP